MNYYYFYFESDYFSMRDPWLTGTMADRRPCGRREISYMLLLLFLGPES